jgi:FkbM family methyltransferase
MANDDINMKEYVSIVREYFKDEDINMIVEVGSLNAQDALFFKDSFLHAHVVAIEGLKENYDKYMKDLQTIECVNGVATDYNGTTTFHVKTVNGIHSIFDRGAAYGTETREVDCFRLDSMFLAPIDMMKIDVEGATYEVLEGMGDLLGQTKIMHIETESIQFFKGQKLHGAVAELLTNAGFSMVRQSQVRISGGYQYDSVWVNNEYMDSE